NIKYDKGIIIFNDNNIIRVSSFFPEFSVFDNQTLKCQRNPFNLPNKKSVKKDLVNKKVVINEKNDTKQKNSYHEIFSASPVGSLQMGDALREVPASMTGSTQMGCALGEVPA